MLLAVGLCAVFSGVTGFGLSIALADADAWIAGLKFLALGLAGIVAVVSWRSESV